MKTPITQEEIASNLLCNLDIHKSMGLDGIHLSLLMELAEELAMLLSVITNSPG